MATETPTMTQTKETDEEQKLRVQLGQFVMDFIKALSKTGYYDTDHPEARGARAGLHLAFRALMKDRLELGYVRAASAENPEILVEGVLTEPINLAALLGKGVGALFVPKLYEYFERHALQMLTIKAEIDEKEFDTLIEVLTREQSAGRVDGRPNLGQVLIEREVFHVSTLFTEELVGRERRINWRVRLALSRLRKDLRVLPLFREAGERAQGRAKRQIIDDVVRPLHRPDFLCSLLLNTDLVGTDPALLDGGTIELHVVRTMPPLLVAPTLVGTTKEVAGYATAAGGLDKVGGAPRLRNLLVVLADRAHGVGGNAGYDALTGLFQAQLISPGELSPGLREFLQVQRLAQGLAANPEAGLKQMREYLARPAADGTLPLGPLVAELLRRSELSLASAALQMAQEVPQVLGRARELLGREMVLRPLIHKFVTAPKERRDLIGEIFLQIGPAALDLLIDLFAASDDRAVRRAACTAVARFGKAAVVPLVDRLEARNLPWFVTRNIVMILGNIGLEVPLDFRTFLRHDHYRVREEAASALARLPVPGAEGLLFIALRDSHAVVRARAVASLGALGTKNVGALHFMVEAVRRKAGMEKEEDDQVQIEVCHALQQLGNIRHGGDKRVEAVLIEALEAEKRGLLARFGAAGGRAKSPAVRPAIIDTLGVIGTPACTKCLKRIADEEPTPFGPRAKDALKKVLARPA